MWGDWIHCLFNRFNKLFKNKTVVPPQKKYTKVFARENYFKYLYFDKNQF